MNDFYYRMYELGIGDYKPVADDDEDAGMVPLGTPRTPP